MNKSELAIKVAAKTGVTRGAAEQAIDAFTEAVGEALADRQEVKLVGFGSFTVSDRAARTARNPRTGEAVKVAATTMPKFTPGAILRQAVAAGTKPQRASK